MVDYRNDEERAVRACDTRAILDYSVASLWRYPVKSMAGEELDSVSVSARGLCGDRAYGLVDSTHRKIGSARSIKQFGNLLNCHARFANPPESSERAPAVLITLPDGSLVDSRRDDADAKLKAAFGPRVSLMSTAPEGSMIGFDAGTLGGKYADTTTFPASSAAPPGTLFDYASIHLITTATLRRLQEAYPEGQITIQRFRPNLVVDCTDASGFVENSWAGRTLAIGSELMIRVSIPVPRCSIPALPQGDLPHDPRILRTIADHNRVDLGDWGHLPCVGVYADVVQPGIVQRGDQVRLVD